jgi:hypothetical protein
MHRAMERVLLKNEEPKASLDQACKEIDAALIQLRLLRRGGVE